VREYQGWRKNDDPIWMQQLDLNLPTQHNPDLLLTETGGTFPGTQDFRTRISSINRLLRAAHTTHGMHPVLFDAVPAHALYREVFTRSLRPKTVVAILKAMLLGFISPNSN